MTTTTTFQKLEAERLVIRRLQDHDLASFVAYRSLPEVMMYQSWNSFDTKQGQEHIDTFKKLEPFVANNHFQFAVALKANNELMGDLYFRLDALGKQAELGYSFSPKFQGQGFASEAVQALIDHAFNKQGLHRIYASTDPRNLASIKLMKRLNMRQEAHFKESLWFKGAWVDDIIFAILAKEWLEHPPT